MDAEELKIINKWGKNYVLRKITRPIGYKRANFAGTGMAMVGFLRDEETIEEFIKRIYKTTPEEKESDDGRTGNY